MTNKTFTKASVVSIFAVIVLNAPTLLIAVMWPWVFFGPWVLVWLIGYLSWFAILMLSIKKLYG